MEWNSSIYSRMSFSLFPSYSDAIHALLLFPSPQKKKKLPNWNIWVPVLHNDALGTRNRCCAHYSQLLLMSCAVLDKFKGVAMYWSASFATAVKIGHP